MSDKTILAVDDSATVRQMLQLTLSDAGYRVVEASSGDDALNKLHGQQVDLLITDLNMGQGDGITLVKEVRKLPGHRFLPIIMLTSEAQPEKRLAAKQAGVSGWINKPFNPQQLLAVVKMVLK